MLSSTSTTDKCWWRLGAYHSHRASRLLCHEDPLWSICGPLRSFWRSSAVPFSPFTPLWSFAVLCGFYSIGQARSQGAPRGVPRARAKKILHLSLIVQWPCPLIDRLGGLLRKIELLWAVRWASNMPKMHWRPGLRPEPHWRSSRRSPVPDLLVGWGGGHQSQCSTPSAPSAPRFSRLRRFDPVAPRESPVPPLIQSWLRSWYRITVRGFEREVENVIKADTDDLTNYEWHQWRRSAWACGAKPCKMLFSPTVKENRQFTSWFLTSRPMFHGGGLATFEGLPPNPMRDAFTTQIIMKSISTTSHRCKGSRNIANTRRAPKIRGDICTSISRKR